MKKLQSLFIGILVIIGVLALSVHHLQKSSGMSGAKVLNVYNWGDYIYPDLIKKFEK